MLLAHLKAHRPEALPGNLSLANGMTYKETLLDCASCHKTTDPHVESSETTARHATARPHGRLPSTGIHRRVPPSAASATSRRSATTRSTSE